MPTDDRRAAILTLASRGQMKRLDETDLSALAELADDDELTLAELILSRATVRLQPEPVDLLALAEVLNG